MSLLKQASCSGDSGGSGGVGVLQWIRAPEKNLLETN